MGHIANVLSKTTTGQKLIVESKIGLARFEKLKPIAKFLENILWLEKDWHTGRVHLLVP